MSRKLFDFLASGGIACAVLFVFATATWMTIPRLFVSSSGSVVIDQNSLTFAPVPALATGTFPGHISAAAIFAVDDATSEPLFAYQATTTRPLASLTKLMSALILSESNLPWQATTTITTADSDGTTTHLKVGETYTLATLWRVALVGSSNTAISALVRMSGLSTSTFVERMNAKASRLIMPSLHFVEPTGLDPHNVGSAQDIARLLRFALKDSSIAPVLALPQVMLYPPREKERIVWSTNWLLTRWIPHDFTVPVVGKTGYIYDAGYNFAARFINNDGHTLRVVVLGATAPEERFTQARDVARWVFTAAHWPNDVLAPTVAATVLASSTLPAATTPAIPD